MGKISLNIYDGTKIEKTYTAEGYDLMMGTIDDFVELIDVDKLDDEKAIMGMIIKGYSHIKPLVMDMFPGMTDEEFKRVRLTELVQTIIQAGAAIAENFGFLKSGNLKRV